MAKKTGKVQTTPDYIVQDTNQISFTYKNWQGEITQRRAGLVYIWYGQTKYHQEFQWFLHGLCLDKKEFRDFAMKDMTEVKGL